MNYIAGLYSITEDILDRSLIDRLVRQTERGQWQIYEQGKVLIMAGGAGRSTWIHGDERPLSDRRNFVVSFVGRLHNRTELELELGLTSAQMAEGELLCSAYSRWGRNVVTKVVGEYALVIWDPLRLTLLCVCDRMSRVPLYYFSSSRLFAWCNEPTWLLSLPHVPSDINDNRVADYLMAAWQGWRWRHATKWDIPDESFFAHIRRIPVRHVLEVSPGGTTIRPYWDVELPDEGCASEDKYTVDFLEILKEAVRCRMPEIGKCGVIMSGGLDSGSIASLAQHVVPKNLGPLPEVRTYSAVFSDLVECDESKYIKALLDYSGICGQLRTADGDWPLARIPRKLFEGTTPFIWLSADLLFPLIQQAVSEGCAVVMTGHAGDSVMAGHRGSASTPSFIGQVRRVRRVANRLCHRMQREDESGDPLLLHRCLARKVDIKERLIKQEPPLKSMDPGWQYCYEVSLGSVNEFWDSALRSVGQVAGVALTHPFLDHRVVEFLLKMPPEMKYRKKILRQACRGYLPEIIRTRQEKTFFPTLARRGLVEVNRELVEDLLFSKSSVINQREYVNLRTVRRVWRRYLSGTHERLNWSVWFVLSLELWLRKWS